MSIFGVVVQKLGGGFISQCHTAPLWPPFWKTRGSDPRLTESWQVKEFIFSLVRGGFDGVARWLAQGEGLGCGLSPFPWGGGHCEFSRWTRVWICTR